MLPVGPKPSSRMIASSADPKKNARTATVATAIISQPEFEVPDHVGPFAESAAASSLNRGTSPVQPYESMDQSFRFACRNVRALERLPQLFSNLHPAISMIFPKRLIPAIFVVLWATGFIGARYAMPWAEPFTFLAARFVLAFVILAARSALLGSRRLGMAGRAACRHGRRADARRLSRRRVLGHPPRLAGRPFGADRRPAAADHRAPGRQPARREDPAAPLGRAGGGLRRRRHRAVAQARRDWRRRDLGHAYRLPRRRGRHERRHDLAEALSRPAATSIAGTCWQYAGGALVMASCRSPSRRGASRSTAS